MTAFLFKSLYWLLARLPLSALHRLGAMLGRLTYAASGTYAARTRDNLRQAGIAPELLPAAIAEAGKGLTELPWIWGRAYDEVLSKVRECIGLEHIEAAQAQGRGIIFLTPHLGCFEISALYAAQRIPITSLYRPPRIGFLEGVMRAGRERGQAKLAKADVGGVRLLYKALKRGEAVGLLPDQVPSRGEGEWTGFFGRPAYTMTLAARLVQQTGAALLLIWAERLPQGRGYLLRVSPPAQPLVPIHTPGQR